MPYIMTYLMSNITIIMIMSRDKEGGSHNTADILLSLKNVIVHPGLSPQVLQKKHQKIISENYEQE